MWFCSCFTPCKGIQDSLGFRIPRRGFRIPGAGFQSLSVKLGSRIPIVTGILDSLSCFLYFKAQGSRFYKQKFPGFVYMGRRVTDWHHDEVDEVFQVSDCKLLS